jgi:hypothetical protein
MITTDSEIRVEWLKCSKSAAYFIYNYCQIYDATEGDWIPFHLWPEQVAVLQALVAHPLNVILKARQLGQTWLVLCFVLWKMLFKPAFTALLFSRRENEAIVLLGKQRLRGIYSRLPKWMRVKQILQDASHEWALSNGSIAYGFPTTAGDSYTASFAFVDEADLLPDLDSLMNAVKPTIDGGGGMCLLSRADKTTPNSLFKRTYRAAKAGKSPWNAIFLPWSVRPERDAAWYATQKADILTRTGSLDDLYQQYPATDDEALAPPQLDRRIPYAWIMKCFRETPVITDHGYNLPFLELFTPLNIGHQYMIGADPAEGNPTSDPSVASVVDRNTLEEVCVLDGKVEPKVFAGYLVSLSKIFRGAPLMVERNNHGHAVILALEEIYNFRNRLLCGEDRRVGWQTTSKSKELMYSNGADVLRDGRAIIHCPTTKTQLSLIEGSTLKAPEGEHDDHAVAYMLSLTSAAASPVGAFAVNYTERQ